MYENSCYERQLRIKREKVRARWRSIVHRINLVTRISKAIAERSYAITLESKCFIDIGDDVTAAVSYGGGRTINPENYKKKNEITFCNDVRTTLGQPPEHRTLVQLDQAVMELQKIAVFSKYPLDIQEKMIRKGLYLRIGPKRIIVRQGHKAQYFYIAVSGEAYAKQKVYDETAGCEIVKTLKCISAGMTFGELALIRGGLRTASVVSRVSMQLIGVHIDDFYEIFITPKMMEMMPDHVSFLRKMDIMIDWPTEQLLQYPSLCKMEYFRNNTVITFDSWNCPNLYIVRTGYCKVFRMLEWKDSVMR
ncbi:cyclic nucleotide-binding domain-containing protein 2-like isoform X2 [Pomacea canaliculata]|uniref:cyclic nucleotide-binding domain-containing protein 2-like isoform X2 n=1 Tax=Pomacea canaliculata TaxID=400727 RepID=UPI000D726289|nr:cyclic nucleotide-binding domain-containing protein 2-like isoform X2 [Pomacea canaliculata]